MKKSVGKRKYHDSCLLLLKDTRFVSNYQQVSVKSYTVPEVYSWGPGHVLPIPTPAREYLRYFRFVECHWI